MVNAAGQQSSSLVRVPECRLADDLGQLLESGAFADVTLAVGGRELHAHKGSLFTFACTSPTLDYCTCTSTSTTLPVAIANEAY